MFWLAVSAAAGDVSITRSDTEEKSRGEGFWRSRTAVSIGAANINYEGLHRKDSSELIQEKYCDRRFGLLWPKEKGWNWSSESFLKVAVNSNGKNFDGTGRYILRECQTLAEGKRAMAEFIWPLADASSAEEKDAPGLRLRVLHDSAWKEWLFVRISVNGGDALLKELQLGCYPSCSSGPPERERWILFPGGHKNMGSGKVTLPSETAGLAYHNKYQQTRDGCFLVYQPNEVEEVKVAGTYGVGTAIVMKPGIRTTVLALGYFLDTPWEDAGRMFLSETLSQVSAQIDRIDWSPVLPLTEFDSLIARTGRLLESPAPWPEAVIPVTPPVTAARSAAAKSFADVKTAYEQARTTKSLDGMLAAVRDAAALREKNAEDALKLIE